MMATKNLKVRVSGFWVKVIAVNKETYPRIELHLFLNLCDLSSDENWQGLHEILILNTACLKPKLKFAI